MTVSAEIALQGISQQHTHVTIQVLFGYFPLPVRGVLENTAAGLVLRKIGVTN